MSNKFEGFEKNKEDFEDDSNSNPEISNAPETNVEEINIKIEEALENLEKNGAELVNTVDSIGGEEGLREMLENNEDSGKDIFKHLRNFILISSAIGSIPIAYSIKNPESYNKLVEAIDPLVILGTIGTPAAIYLLVEGIKSGELIKGIKEIFLGFKNTRNLKNIKKNSQNRREKEERHERFMERNFSE